MKNYRPLLLQNIELSLPGIEVHRLRLNQHTPEGVWTEHEHETAQLLIYLAGRGRQKVAGADYDCRPGTVIHVPPGTRHAFERQRVRQPLCLVLDVSLGATRGTPHVSSQLAASDLSHVRVIVSRLFRMQKLEQREAMLQVGAYLLEILDKVLRTIGWLDPVNRYGATKMLSTTRICRRVIENHDGPETTLADLAREAGYQQDYLNRILKEECGLTLGQLRSRVRLESAQKLLVKGFAIQDVAEKVGILDNNYFARWFRQQTGVSPTQWRKRPKEVVRT